LDNNDAFAHCAFGQLHLVDRSLEEALAEFRTAISINPSFADAHRQVGFCLCHMGRAEEAISPVKLAIQISPKDAVIGTYYTGLALAHLYLRDYEEAEKWGKMAVRQPISPWPCYVFLISALAHQNKTTEVGEVLADLYKLRPDISLSFVEERVPTIDRGYMDHLIDGLRKAGLPE
jgi:tetratricopeptide (TPR) repeat protein